MNENMSHAVKTAGDIAAVGVTVGTILKWLPAIAAAFTIIWTAIRIYETETVQSAIKRIRKGKKP